MSTHLVFPDPHANPHYDNRRFDWAGKLLMDVKPDVHVCLGDLACCPSLSSYDKGLKSFEGQRWLRDVAVTIDAQERWFGPLREYNDARRRNKARLYTPRNILLGGNHDEGRIHKTIQKSPELSGVVDISAFRYGDYWDIYVPFRQHVVVDGVAYSHHFVSGAMGRAISRPNLGAKLVRKWHQSCVVGHDHGLDIHHEAQLDGKKIWGISAGCFFEHTPDYAQDSAWDWWRGVLILKNVRDGDFDFELVSLKELEKEYG